jgi:hypothetical protein
MLIFDTSSIDRTAALQSEGSVHSAAELMIAYRRWFRQVAGYVRVILHVVGDGGRWLATWRLHSSTGQDSGGSHGLATQQTNRRENIEEEGRGG